MASRKVPAPQAASPRRPNQRVRRDLSPLGRWLEVLNAYVLKDEWGVRELATAIDLPRSAVHRILHEMRRLGLLSASDSTGQFKVGPVLARLSIVLARRLDVTRVGRPVLEEVASLTDETVILGLYAPTRHQVFAVDAVESPHPVRYIWDSVRGWRDLHAGATGKGVLAFLTDSEQDEIIAALPDPILLARPIRKATLRRQLKDAQRVGYVVSRGETFEGAVAVAAPIHDATGAVVGDMVISWPDNRTSPEREKQHGEIVRAGAAAVSRGLGYVDSTGRPLP